MKIMPITINNISFGKNKNLKKAAIPFIALSTLAITPSCDSRKPYNECTQVEADSLYRQEHAEYYAKYPNHRRSYTEKCPCTSCDSARVVFAEQDSIANVEKQKAERLQQKQDSIAEAKRVQAKRKEAEQTKFYQTVAKNVTKAINKSYYDISYHDGSFFESERYEMKKVSDNKWSKSHVLEPDMFIEIINQQNGDYDVVTNIVSWHHPVKYGFTKDHRYKDGQHYAEIEAQKQKAYFDENAGELVSLALFNGINKDAMSKIASKIKIDNVEYIEKGNGVYNLFFNKDGVGYDVVLKNTGNNGTYAGIARKLLANGKSELYIFKTEHFETNKSDKIRVSRLQVIQDGLDDSSPTTKKGLHETKKSGENVTYTTNDLNGKSRINMIIRGIPNFLEPGMNYDGKATSNAIHKINEFITESNAEGKIITVYSCPKNSDTVEMNGKVIK